MGSPLNRSLTGADDSCGAFVRRECEAETPVAELQEHGHRRRDVTPTALYVCLALSPLLLVAGLGRRMAFARTRRRRGR